MSFIKNLSLNNYRVYKNNSFNFGENINIIYGKNGIGKTNILEALSLLSPGKGLLNADVDEILKKDEKIGWSVLAKLEHELVESVAVYTEESKKKIKINGNIIRGQNELNNIFNIIWLTPNMQNFFMEEKAVRRKFLDRCVYMFDLQHAARVSKYEFLVKERLKVLLEPSKTDEKWLLVLEQRIAEAGVAIAKARESLVKKMNALLEKSDFDFPKFTLHIEDGVFLDNLNFQEILLKNRTKDRETKRTNDGVHKSDLELFYYTKNMNAKLCSTGEQKLLLISLTLLRAFMCIDEKISSPIILLDEVFSYLDNRKKTALFLELKNLKVQSFITATDINIFDDMIDDDIKVIKLEK
jgi:DNA replication and repair protein RecF